MLVLHKNESYIKICCIHCSQYDSFFIKKTNNTGKRHLPVCEIRQTAEQLHRRQESESVILTMDEQFILSRCISAVLGFGPQCAIPI